VFIFLQCIFLLILKLRNALALVGAILGLEHLREITASPLVELLGQLPCDFSRLLPLP
jgi:hypothetical protein